MSTAKGKRNDKERLKLRDFLDRFSTLAALLILALILTIATKGNFIKLHNISNVLLQASVNAVIAAGMTVVIITAGIDLSVGSIVALAGVVMASFLKYGIPIIKGGHLAHIPLSPGLSLVIGLVVALIVGALLGLINGFMITKMNLPPFIATLAMMSIARGMALVYTSGRPISGFHENFRFIANGSVFCIPMPVIIVAIVYLVFYIFLNHTKAGRYIYAIGGNEEAAYLSGINVNKYKLLAYVISGLTAAIGAIILTSRINSGQPTAGIMYELDAIAATVIGGTSLVGGEGSVIGTLIGALIISVLRNGLNLLNVSSYWQQVIIGLVIALAVFLDKFRRR